jgi:RHS repeat-associated protein
MHVFAGGTRMVSKLVRQPRDVDGDGVLDPIDGCANPPWGWTNGNGGGNGNGNAGGNGNGQGPCGNNGNGNGGGSGPEVFERDQYFYHPDHLGSSSYVTDIDGEIFQHLEYFPFGETWVEESSNTQRTPYLFTGKELDEQTGLYYFGARYYDPRTSVWQSPDPILAKYLQGTGAGLGVYTPRNLNLFAYSHLRPVIMIDPDGMEPRGGEWLLDQALRKGHAALVWMTGSEENARATVVGVAELHPVVGLASGIDSAETPAGVGTAVALETLGPLADAAKWGSRLVRGGDDVAAGMGRVCSFHGDTLVLTAQGMKAISGIELGDLVWSRNPATGQMGWKRVLAQYSNPYEETVYVSIRDAETGVEQVIISNRIHPFFVQRGATQGAMSISQSLRPSSEGHVYRGPIVGGAWVDAADLQSGDRLLNADGSWAVVSGVEVKEEVLTAYNLTVDSFSTFFVAGHADAESVWIHNECPRARATAQQILQADRSGTALVKSDAGHRAASFASEDQLAAGTVFDIVGGDGVSRTLLQAPGNSNGRDGIFEFLLDADGTVSHQRFIRGGEVNGIINQVVRD